MEIEGKKPFSFFQLKIKTSSLSILSHYYVWKKIKIELNILIENMTNTLLEGWGKVYQWLLIYSYIGEIISGVLLYTHVTTDYSNILSIYKC